MICMVSGFDDLRGLPGSLGFLFLWAYDPFCVLVLPVRLGSFFGSTIECRPACFTLLAWHLCRHVIDSESQAGPESQFQPAQTKISGPPGVCVGCLIFPRQLGPNYY